MSSNSVLEKADNRIVHHISDIISKGYWKIIVHTVDSEVVVILLGFMSEFTVTNPKVEIKVAFKTSSGSKYISISSIYSNLGIEYLFWFAILLLLHQSGFYLLIFQTIKKGLIWEMVRFSNERRVELIVSRFIKIPKERHLLIQQFVVYVYLRKFDFIDLDELCCQMFVYSSSNDFRTLPPFKFSLFQHLLRASYQSDGYREIHCCGKLLLRRSHGVGEFTGGI